MRIVPNENISFPIGTILAVQGYYKTLGLEQVFSKHKTRGNDINNLLIGLLSYRLSDNHSITKAAEWINREDILDILGLESFDQRCLYRVFEIIGSNHEEIMADIQRMLFESYEFSHTNINMDWTSITLHGQKCPLGKYGYSKDHRPDKKQINVGIAEISHPINVPIGMTIQKGNINDQVHFQSTFKQVKRLLVEDSLVIFDQGGNRKKNLELVDAALMKYLTIRQLNKSDETNRIKEFDKSKAELVDPINMVWGIKYVWPSRIDYFYFSEKSRDNQIEAKKRKIQRMYDEAKAIQDCIDKNKGLPKRFRINNPLVHCEYSYQTLLNEFTEKEAIEILTKKAITGREGFFCIVSNKDLTLEKALKTYRLKDSIEKIFNSLKNELDIKPLRVWTVNAINGALLIAFMSQLMISLMRLDIEVTQHTSTKFIRKDLIDLTVTIEKKNDGSKRFIFSNFTPISKAVVTLKYAIP